jgi:hypothetical protein
MMRLSQAGIPTVLLVGNHDVSPASGRAHTLQEFSTLAVPYIHIADRITRPIGRGVVVSSSLLCQVPPPPPPGADSNLPAPDPNVSTRVRFEQHRKDPACATCHALFDPLGVPFEIYDGVGTFRTSDGGKVVDAASELKGTKASDGPVKNALELVRKLSTAEEVRSCFARQMFRYAFGRAEGDRDADIIAAGLAAMGRTGRIPDVMTAMAASPGFRNRLPLDLK